MHFYQCHNKEGVLSGKKGENTRETHEKGSETPGGYKEEEPVKHINDRAKQPLPTCAQATQETRETRETPSPSPNEVVNAIQQLALVQV